MYSGQCPQLRESVLWRHAFPCQLLPTHHKLTVQSWGDMILDHIQYAHNLQKLNIAQHNVGKTKLCKC